MENIIKAGKNIQDETPKKQKISVTYTLRAFQENVRKLEQLELIDEKDKKQLEEITKKVLIKYVSI